MSSWAAVPPPPLGLGPGVTGFSGAPQLGLHEREGRLREIQRRVHSTADDPVHVRSSWRPCQASPVSSTHRPRPPNPSRLGHPDGPHFHGVATNRGRMPSCVTAHFELTASSPLSESPVSLHGGQVISWRNDRAEELLFTSSKAIFKPPKAIRGGIPLCFPQFGSCGSLEQHGFARNRIWTIEDDPPPFHPKDCNGKVSVDLLLRPSEEDLKCWPHCFEFRLRVSLGMDGDLSMISRIRNIDGKPFSFSFAYHTYFSVSDISEVRIEGLETLDYLDNLCQRERFTEQGDALTFESEVDRVYLGSPNVVAVLDHEKKRTFLIRKEGLPDIVVWNPWEKKSKSMIDLGAEEYKQTLCVDGAAVERPITLRPGEEWTGRLDLSVVPSSYCSEHLDPLRCV